MTPVGLLSRLACTPAIAALAFLAACGGKNDGANPVPPQQMQTRTVQLLAGPPGANPEPRILVAMPSASPFSMALDTGSTGLRLLPSALGSVPMSSYTDTGTPVAAVFGNDRVYYGTIGIAQPGVVIGGALRIAKPLKFQIIDAVCSGVPSPLPTGVPANCNDVTAKYEQDLIGGVMGVRPSATGNFSSPLAELPAPYSDGFIVSDYGTSPGLTVGATADDRTGFELYTVGAATASDGSPAWTGNALLPWCYSVTVPGAMPVAGCPSAGVLTDSGGENERLYLPIAPPGALAPNTLATLPPGSTVVATLGTPGSGITWSLTTGTCTYYDAPAVDFTGATQASAASSNAIAPFYTNDVLFDLRDGEFGFRPVTPVPPPFCP